ncbi:transcription factor bHLH92-like [Quillaja saponaria]|uniref:Transcription factor bHLH92-like n=1 Tax=Quillaja saponaria TaxID=32244 RepID=A0AAD7PGJ5_QUISA|nr:transcription factor bHLH92-like [Quillaja saponaria]
MDDFFPEKFLGEIFWDEQLPPPPPNPSAFVQYTALPRIELMQKSSGEGSNSKNMNKKMVEFLRRSRPKVTTEHEKERCFRHMINERMRRQRQKQSCLALHSLLPFGTKSDCNSVIQTAAKEIQTLQGYREELQRQRSELEESLKAVEGTSTLVGGTRINLRVPNPTSGIDSMVETLKCLKSLGVNTKRIKSKFSSEEIFAVLETDSVIAAAQVESAIGITLTEFERKFSVPFPLKYD